MKKVHMIKSVVNKAKFEGMKILFVGDMNAHIWELDRCENGNGRLLKQLAGDLIGTSDYELCVEMNE